MSIFLPPITGRHLGGCFLPPFVVGEVFSSTIKVPLKRLGGGFFHLNVAILIVAYPIAPSGSPTSFPKTGFANKIDCQGRWFLPPLCRFQAVRGGISFHRRGVNPSTRGGIFFHISAEIGGAFFHLKRVDPSTCRDRKPSAARLPG